MERIHPELDQALEKFGDRTSSFVTAYPHFEEYSVRGEGGRIRYVRTQKALIAATEPLTDVNARAIAFEEFSEFARTQKLKSTIFPVSDSLSKRLVDRGYRRQQIGIEPIFVLKDLFKDKVEPLETLKIAKRLKLRGARVRELKGKELEKFSPELTALAKSWLMSKGRFEIGFLSGLNPFLFSEKKRYFVLEYRKECLGFLAINPIPASNSFYFADLIRGKNARSGSAELLAIEAMRKLHFEGVNEVHLGMCPLAGLKGHSPSTVVLRTLFKHWSLGYSFKTLYEFKKKFSPTRWEPLFVVSNEKNKLLMCFDLLNAHFRKGFFGSLFSLLEPSLAGLKKKYFTLLEGADRFLDKKKITSVSNLLYRTKFTLSFCALFVSIHLLRPYFEELRTLHSMSAFSPQNINFYGLFFSPLFHNHAFHLIGDQISYFIFGGLLEVLAGPVFYLIVTAAGLWLSNPLTVLFVSIPISYLDAKDFSSFLSEIDYGSSNNVYAIVGAMSGIIKSPLWLLLPFLINGILICVFKHSYLSLHHIVALGMGFSIARLALYFTKRFTRRAQ